MFQRLQPPKDVVWLRILSENAAKPKEIEVLVGRTSYFTRLLARTVYVFLRGDLSGALWGSPGLSLPHLGTLLEPFAPPQADFWRAGTLKSTNSVVLSRFS